MNALDDMGALLHDINSRCLSLKSAAEMIEALPTQEADALLGLMDAQTRKLSRDIAFYRKRRGLAK